VPSFSHLTSCTTTKSSLYFPNSLATVFNEPALYRLLTFHMPNLISIFRCLRLARDSVHFGGPCTYFATNIMFYGGWLLALRPNPKLESPPLSAVLDCLFNIFAAATLHIWRPTPPSANWGRAMTGTFYTVLYIQVRTIDYVSI
jgi:hypothetical protein